MANWLEIDSDYVISERSEQLIRTAAETFSHLWRPDGTSDPLADQLAEIWEAFEDRAAADTSVMEPLSSRIDTNTLLAAISEMLVCDPECEKVPLDFRDFAGLEKPIVPLKLSAEDTFELLEYDPALGTVTKSSRVAYITLMLKLAVMNSGGDGPTVSGQLRWLELVVEQRYPGPKPSVELMLGELIARNLPVYDGESDEWVRFDTWSKQLVVRVDPSGVDTPFRRDPVGGTVSMIADPSADNIRHLLGLGN
ncbi:MAG: hypothetical protein BZY88_03000 [SAR202 cluster bacterium Io17-Chloro-G9]|nr:MAG: hypothetical protein BZY88_03000 [SAR202 cluster bacterium Io17-Chloro-G9]